jgi:hypothetical protein
MPYISREERPAIDARVEALAQEISSALGRGENKETEVSVYYRQSFKIVAGALLGLERGKTQQVPSGAAGELALELFAASSQSSAHKGAWLGRLNYALTRLIQVVPTKMVEKGFWKEDFRYWLYAQTVGALVRTAMEVHSDGDDWATDGVVGVLFDVKDEYKRRVNSAYETFQILKAGDAYTTRFRADSSEVKDERGKVIGYTEVMKDLRTG